MTTDPMPRCMIERNLATSLLMQLDGDVSPVDVAASLPRL